VPTLVVELLRLSASVVHDLLGFTEDSFNIARQVKMQTTIAAGEQAYSANAAGLIRIKQAGFSIAGQFEFRSLPNRVTPDRTRARPTGGSGKSALLLSNHQPSARIF
jgi:hypothetical protein